MNDISTSHLLEPLSIGDISIDPPLLLAPIAGYTNYAFRTICRELGDCGLVSTGLLNANGIIYKSYRTQKMLDWQPHESPIAVQLYGPDPAMVAEAARRVVVDLGADIVDLNMGCAVRKITRRGMGAALLRELDAVARAVEAVRAAVPPHVPVTVKIRSGWNADSINAVEVARTAEAAGAAAVTVHARTAAQGYAGRADWDIIRQVKQAVSVPVVGNGDVRATADVVRMRGETGCDAVMIGRAALGAPWVFHRIAHELRSGEVLPPPTVPEKVAVMLRHARRFLETTPLPEYNAICELRGQLVKYHVGAPGAPAFRRRLVQTKSLADVEALLRSLA